MLFSNFRAIFTTKTDGYDLKWRENHVRQFLGGGVLLVRNPFQAVISFWSWEKTNTHSTPASKKSFCSVEFREFVYKSVIRWVELMEDWMTWSDNLHIIFFEDLVKSPIEKILSICHHLKLQTSDERSNCLRSHLRGKFHRKKTMDVNPYTQDHMKIFNWALERVNKTLFRKFNIQLPHYENDFSKIKCDKIR